MKAKHQRMTLVVLAIVAILSAGLIAAWALQNQASFFYLPEQIASDPPEVGQPVRLGGMVEQGSLQMLDDGVSVRFNVTGPEGGSVAVAYSGILPDLFVEGSGMVADGALQADGTFLADEILAKHDENYVPKELEGLEGHSDTDYAATLAGQE